MAPVVSAALGALGPVLGKLTTLLADECYRLKGVRREIRSLRSELTSMHAALQSYSMLEDPSVQVKAWISLVRELAYDTEDCIDKFIHKLGHGGQQAGGVKEFFRSTVRRLKTLRSRRRVANQIGNLKARVMEVQEQKNRYKLDDVPRANSDHISVDPRLSALFAEEAHLVGIEGPRDDLARWMLEEGNSSTERHRRVLSIVGFGGLGKTTLANEVYRKIRGHFHCHAFVSVSQKPDPKKIIKDVISQVISQVTYQDSFTEDMNIWDENKSIAKLRELLQDKSYLVIIDDIWSIPAWDAIKFAFPENNCSSKIIATTRIVDVARSCCSGGDDRIYQMEPLSDIHSKALFSARIFGSRHCCPDMFKEISNEILKKCGGLPLAIISVSSLLASRATVKEEWERVKRSIGSALERCKSLEGLWLESDPKERITIHGFPCLREFLLVCRERTGGAYLTFAKGAMPKLEKLRLPFHVSMATTCGFYFGIGHLPCLRDVVVYLYKEGAGYSEIRAAATVIRNEACVHPNHPRVIISGEDDEDSDD